MVELIPWLLWASFLLEAQYGCLSDLQEVMWILIFWYGLLWLTNEHCEDHMTTALNADTNEVIINIKHLVTCMQDTCGLRKAAGFVHSHASSTVTLYHTG